MVGQGGFFDIDDRLKDLSAKGDDLERLNAIVDFEIFRTDLEGAVPRADRAKGGRPPYDHVLMFKVLILQSSHSLSDERTEYLIKDRLSFMRFLGLTLADRVPDANSIWNFREALTRTIVDGKPAIEVLFKRFDARWPRRDSSPWAGRSSTPRSSPRQSSATPRPRRRRSRKAASPRIGKPSPQNCARRTAMRVGRSSLRRPSLPRKAQSGSISRSPPLATRTISASTALMA